MKVRKRVAPVSAKGRPWQLQWGRTREGAETRCAVRRDEAEVLASMGPHP